MAPENSNQKNIHKLLQAAAYLQRGNRNGSSYCINLLSNFHQKSILYHSIDINIIYYMLECKSEANIKYNTVDDKMTS